MKINWKVRFKNKLFWLAFIPAVLMLVKSVANVFGITLDFIELESDLKAVIEALFLVLGLVGVVIDPTTAGASDSENALTYTEPKK